MSKTVKLEDVISVISRHEALTTSIRTVLFDRLNELPHESKEQWISVTNGWPKINGWFLTKRQSENGTIKYSANWFLTEHPGDCEMEETGWHNVVEYKLIEAYLPSPPTK